MEEQKSNIPQPKAESAPKAPAPPKQPGAASNTAPKLSQAEVAKGNPQAVQTQPKVEPAKQNKQQTQPVQQPQQAPSIKTQKMIDSLKNKSYSELSGLQNQYNKIKGDMSPEEAKLVQKSLDDAMSKEKELAMKRYLSIGKMLESNSGKLDTDTMNKAKELLDSKSWTEGVSQKEFDNLISAGTRNKENARLQAERDKAEKERTAKNTRTANELIGMLGNVGTKLPSEFKSYLQKQIDNQGGMVEGDLMDFVNDKYQSWSNAKRAAENRSLTGNERLLRLLFGELYQPKNWYGSNKRR